MSSCRRVGCAVLASAMLSPVVCAAPLPDDGGVVGWVESTRGAPVAGAVVSIFGKGIRGGSLITLTDAEDQFVLPSLPAGSYTLRGVGSGHQASAAQHVTVLPNRDAIFTLSLTPVSAKPAGALPDAPGVYLFSDAGGHIIYVGKAASLRKRVRSYFREGEAGGPRLARLRESIADLDFMAYAGEVEALILEANLIKRYHPIYNIEFRDDKSYPYMAVCTGDAFPRVMFARGQRRKDTLYFGPFAHAGAVRETMATLRKVFPFRACRGHEPGKSTGSPCLDYHIRLCSGPCVGAVSQADYKRIIDGVVEFMEGGHEAILEGLEKRMREEAGRQEYELAARTRDRRWPSARTATTPSPIRRSAPVRTAVATCGLAAPRRSRGRRARPRKPRRLPRPPPARPRRRASRGTSVTASACSALSWRRRGRS